MTDRAALGVMVAVAALTSLSSCSAGKTNTIPAGAGGMSNPDGVVPMGQGGDPGVALPGGSSSEQATNPGFAAAGGNTGETEIPTLAVGDGLLKVEVCAENIIRVAYAKSADFFNRTSLVTSPKRCGGDASWSRTATATESTIRTARLAARVELASGRVTFLDAAGSVILAEKSDGRALTPTLIQGDATHSVRQEWLPNTDESLYGLGQHQYGLLDIRGYDLDLKQYNTQVAVPFLASSRGYGILWDNTSFSRYGDLRPFEALPGTTGLYSAAATGEVDASSGSVDWEGTIRAPETGDYLVQTYASGDVKLWVDGTLVIDHWRQGWLPYTELARVRLQAGQDVPVRLAWTSDIGVETLRVMWKTPSPEPSTSLWSEVADGVDYYFVYGPELDSVVAGYRRLTGDAPMPPRHAFGLWQSRERYRTAQESLDVVSGYRSRGIPLDNIVQDWQYWTENAWGSHEFDPARFPDPAGWIRELHDAHHVRLMISVWPKFYTGTANFEALRSRGFLYELNLSEQREDFVGYPFTFYDAFNPAARSFYWSQIERELFSKGVDAWWMDATEPDIVEGPFPSPEEQLEVFKTHMHETALGSGSSVLNAYSLVNSQAVYEGHRTAAPDRRVFILTRNGFAGQQRYGAVTWSGDVTSTWTALKKQVPAGLGFSLSGIPYWTVDSGGFAVPPRFANNPSPADLAEWRELNTRWFQFATFLPILRVHGQAPLREMWEFGGEGSPSYQAQLKFTRLRYRLLPYVYSLAGEVTHGGGTLLRALVMDFPNDASARDVPDQFSLGRGLMVSPVTTAGAQTRSVYLPEGRWFDFWSGESVAGGQTIEAASPYDSIPVHVRAGSIIPMGPELQYVDERPADPIVIYVYPGADGAFTLYEDDGATYGYERGAFSRIPLRWNDATRTLVIGAREGAFTGMLGARVFNVVLASETQPVPFSFTPSPARAIDYSGEALEAQF